MGVTDEKIRVNWGGEDDDVIRLGLPCAFSVYRLTSDLVVENHTSPVVFY